MANRQPITVKPKSKSLCSATYAAVERPAKLKPTTWISGKRNRPPMISPNQ